MHTLLTPLVELTERLLKVSAQAAILIVLVLLVKAVMGRKLPPRVSYALWLIVVARLLLPVSLESGFSIFNLSTSTPAKVFRADGEGSSASAVNAEAKRASAPEVASGSPTGPAPTARAAAEKVPASRATVPAPGKVAGARAGQPTRPAVGVGKPFPWTEVLALTWLAGVVFLLARIIWIPLRLNAALARHETATSPAVFEILEESKRLSGVNQVLPIVQSRAVESPALLGFIRPWLLLPEGLVEKFSPQELRLVFLHELAHLKRRDIAVNWLATLLQILHWPNPFVWLAFARMRADREVACDELALSFAREGEGHAYGHAIIKLLEGFRRPTALPGLVGILEDQTQMQKRITMIAQFKKMTGWSTAAIGLVLGIGLVTLTDAQTEKAKEPARIFSTDHPTVKTLVSGTSEDVYGVLAPDESTIVYSTWSNEGGDLAIRDLRTGQSKILVAASRRVGSYDFPIYPTWSSDSKAIAYTWESENGRESLRIVSRDGGEPKVIRSEKDEGFWSSDWSRDGQLLVGEWVRWGKNSKPFELAVMDLGSGKLRSLGLEGTHARFSPDGRFVVCERITKGNRDVFIVSMDGGRTTRVTSSPAEDGCPVFSSDGRFVLFSSNQRGSWDLWAVRVDMGELVGVARPVRYDIGDHHKWITSTGRMAFSISGSGVNGVFWSDVFEISAARSPAAAEKSPRPVAKAFAGRNFNPAWSPDGSKFAYVRFRGTTVWYPLLCVQNIADGTEQVFESGMRQIVGRVHWSPDGQTIAMRGIGDETTSGVTVYLFSPGERRRIPEPFNAGLPMGFAPDGKELLFLDLKQSERVAVNIATRARRSIPSPAGLDDVKRTWVKNGGATWNETFAVYLAKEGSEQQIIVADADFGNKRVVARVSEPMSFYAPSLSPDRKKIAYVTVPGDSKQRQQLHLASVDGSWDRIVETGGKYVQGGAACSWSPDSMKLVLTLREDLPGEIGVLENFLPAEKVVAK